MRTTIRDIFYFVSDLLMPARRGQALLRTLTLAQLKALARYDGSLPYQEPVVRALVWELKYHAEGAAVALAGEYLAEFLIDEASDCVGTPLVIPMPMHTARRKARGHNQTELLCDSALRSLGEAGGGIEYNPHILIRTRHTAPQQGLARHARLSNVKDSMQVVYPELVEGRICIVVDDVTTTGASFVEAKRALRDAGAAEVRTLALARS